MTRKSIDINTAAERRNNEHLTEFESNGCDASSERCKIIFVIVRDFLNQAVFAKSSDDRGYHDMRTWTEEAYGFGRCGNR